MNLVKEIEKVRDLHCDFEKLFGDNFVGSNSISKELFKEVASNNYEIRRLLTINVSLLEGK